MGRVSTAFRAFFRALFDAEVAERVELALDQAPATEPAALPTPAAPVQPKPVRSDALNLLAVLQREGRLIDFLKEPIDAYTDAQIGAAVRDVHRDCAAALERMFAVRPVRSEGEGTGIEVPAGFDAGRLRLTGNVAGQPPYRGTLRHQGWEAQKAEVPQWSGSTAAARIIAPAEVEI